MKDIDELKRKSYNTKEMLDQMKKSKIEELSREA